MDEKPSCPHCKRKFNSVSARNYHVKAAQYCLNNRGEKLIKVECKYCDAKIAECNLKNHIDNGHCRKYTQKLVEKNRKMEKELKILRKKVEKMEKQFNQEKEKAILKAEVQILKATARNISNSQPIELDATIEIIPFTTELFKDNISKFTSSHLQNGVHGIAQFIADVVTQDGYRNYYYSNDNNRKKFLYFSEKSGWQIDSEGIILAQTAYSVIAPRAKELHYEYEDMLIARKNNPRDFTVNRENCKEMVDRSLFLVSDLQDAAKEQGHKMNGKIRDALKGMISGATVNKE